MKHFRNRGESETKRIRLGEGAGKSFWNFSVLLGAALLLAVPLQVAHAAETVHLYLTGATQGYIKGESTQTTLARADSIECLQVDLNTANDTALRADAIRVVKRIEKSSPLLLRAMVGRELMTGAMFRFYRPNPTGDGTTEQFYTVTLTNARIIGIRQFVPNCIEPASSIQPPQEVVMIGFSGMRWTYTNGGVWGEINFSGTTTPSITR